jgi:hypothetical protein
MHRDYSRGECGSTGCFDKNNSDTSDQGWVSIGDVLQVGEGTEFIIYSI